MGKRYYGELTKLILGSIGKGLFIVTLAGFAGPGAPRLISKFVRYENWRIRRTLRRLHRLRMIELKQDHERRLIAKLTKKGEDVVKKDELLKMKIKKLVKWDEIWRIIAFDIPTEKKISRDYFRNHLYSLGFYQIQKSIFACPYPCEKEVVKLCDFYEIRKNVLLIAAHSLGEQEAVARRFFKL